MQEKEFWEIVARGWEPCQERIKPITEKESFEDHSRNWLDILDEEDDDEDDYI